MGSPGALADTDRTKFIASLLISLFVPVVLQMCTGTITLNELASVSTQQNAIAIDRYVDMYPHPSGPLAAGATPAVMSAPAATLHGKSVDGTFVDSSAAVSDGDAFECSLRLRSVLFRYARLQ